MYVGFPLLMQFPKDILHEQGIDIRDEAILFWQKGFGPLFAGEISMKRVSLYQRWPHWLSLPDKIFVRINGETELSVADF